MKGLEIMLRQNFNFGWTVDKHISPFERLVMGEKAAPREVTLPHDAMIMGLRHTDKPVAGGIAYY